MFEDENAEQENNEDEKEGDEEKKPLKINNEYLRKYQKAGMEFILKLFNYLIHSNEKIKHFGA